MNGSLEIQDVYLNGRIFSTGTLKGSISASYNISGKIMKPVGYDDYSGNYEITPSVDEQSLDVNDKRMTKDIVIKPIPYFKVSNEYMGETVIIGV